MVTAKNPGIGQGKGGGGRKPRESEFVHKQFRLTPEAAEMVKEQAKTTKQPAWKIVDGLIKAAYGFRLFGAEPLPLPMEKTLPTDAAQFAQDAADFLCSYTDRSKALMALQRAWKQSIALARRDME